MAFFNAYAFNKLLSVAIKAGSLICEPGCTVDNLLLESGDIFLLEGATVAVLTFEGA